MDWNLKEDIFFKEVRDHLEKTLEEVAEFYGWTLRISQKNSSQRLLYGNDRNELEPRTIRDNIIEKSYHLSVFTRSGGSMGYGNLTLDPYGEIQPQVEEGIANAREVRNPPWDLVVPVKGESWDEVKQVDPLLRENLAQGADRIAAMASKISAGLQGVKMNYAEIFCSYGCSLKITSTGLEMFSEKSAIYYENAMEPLPLPNTQEVHNNKSTLTIEDLKLEEFINRCALETRLLGKTHVPGTSEEAVILVRYDVISKLLHCLLEQTKASREFLKQPFIPPGELVSEEEPEGDFLNLTLDPGVDFMASSTPFTSEGLKAKKGLLIRQNRLMSQVVSFRMGQYLGKEVNPLAGNIILEGGKNSYEELIRKAPRVIEIISFSSLLLNPHYLTYSSEIKLAREYNHQTGQIRYLKGGVISGSIKENLKSCFFSNKVVRHNVTSGSMDGAEGYIGPEYMLIKRGVAVAGKDK